MSRSRQPAVRRMRGNLSGTPLRLEKNTPVRTRRQSGRLKTTPVPLPAPSLHAGKPSPRHRPAHRYRRKPPVSNTLSPTRTYRPPSGIPYRHTISPPETAKHPGIQRTSHTIMQPFPAISRHHAPIMQNRHPAKKPRHFPACPALTQPPSGTSRHLIPVSCGKPREQPIFSLFRQRLAHPAHQTGNHPVPPSTRKTKKATPQDRPVTKKPPHTPKQPENARAASTRPTG